MGMIGAIDQGTTSTRFILFDSDGREVASSQKEHRQFYPQPGWVEHDPEEIWTNTCHVIQDVIKKASIAPSQIQSIGITNQRETIILWDPVTGKPLHNAIVWQDTRSADIVNHLKALYNKDRFRKKTGLPLAAYFSSTKMQWMLEQNPEFKTMGLKGEACFGTIDSWLIYKLTGGGKDSSFVTDVTNASRTQLMNLKTLKWDQELMETFGIPEKMLPQILPSIPEEPFGYTEKSGPFQAEIPIGCVLGDQQSALFGQACFFSGSSKCTYGTGGFLLVNTGTEIVNSTKGMLTTVACQIGNNKALYALEGSIAVAGSLVQWLRDNLGLIQSSAEVETLAEGCEDSAGVYVVPAFSGLFAPYWQQNARGVITGLTGYANKHHLARAVLEATAYQTRDLIEAMQQDTGLTMDDLKVDGGMVVNQILMQFLADILNVPVIRPTFIETTALGAAYGAGLAAGVWQSLEELKANWEEQKRWIPKMDAADRSGKYRYWKKAVDRSMNWQD